MKNGSRPPSIRKTQKPILSLTVMCLITALSGCSTLPAPGVVWSPAASMLVKSRPLPKLPDDPAANPNVKSSWGLLECTKDSFDVSAMYLELARRHDELVDAVMERLKRQAQ